MQQPWLLAWRRNQQPELLPSLQARHSSRFQILHYGTMKALEIVHLRQPQLFSWPEELPRDLLLLPVG